jgi:hypothetical protein
LKKLLPYVEIKRLYERQEIENIDFAWSGRRSTATTEVAKGAGRR